MLPRLPPTTAEADSSSCPTSASRHFRDWHRQNTLAAYVERSGLPTINEITTVLAHSRSLLAASALATLVASSVVAQGTAADYARAESVHKRLDGLVLDAVDTSVWIGNTTRFWYRKSVKDGSMFMVVDAATLEKKPAFDHAVVAASLSSVAGRPVSPLNLPFNALVYAADERTFDVTVDTMRFTCVVIDSRCTRSQASGGRGGRGGGGGGPRFGGGLYGDVSREAGLQARGALRDVEPGRPDSTKGRPTAVQ